MRQGVWWVYILRCADDSFYTGITTDAQRRLAQHNAGVGAKYTRSRRPAKLAYLECLPSKGEALRREWEVKSLTRKQKEALIAQASLS